MVSKAGGQFLSLHGLHGKSKLVDPVLTSNDGGTRVVDDQDRLSAVRFATSNRVDRISALGRYVNLSIVQFIGSELAGERAAVIMSLFQSAKLNRADPWSYLKDVLTRLPSQLNSRIGELLPHRWKPGT